MPISINISNDFSRTPGGRSIGEGSFSGEKFRKELLKPKFEQAKITNDILIVDLDGGYGYATSFLEEAFGGLARDTKDDDVMKIIIHSAEEPALIDKIAEYMRDALKEKK